MVKAKESGRKPIASNKNAFRLYHLADKYEAGIVLVGTEAKSIRSGVSNMSDAYVYVKNGEAFIANLNITPYAFGNRQNHEPLRTRKLLLHKAEIDKLRAAVEEKGRTIVAIQLFYQKGRVKVEIAVATGKKLHDKRQDLKEKDDRREMSRAIKRNRHDD